MKTATSSSPVRQRILETASDLFYRQGYQATGINQIIADSAVAKASFYDHFPSKVDLLVAYAEATAAREMREMREEVMALPTARERFFAPLRLLPPWLESCDYRGCPFQLLLSEAPPDEPRIRAIARRHHEEVRLLFRHIAWDLIRGDPGLAHHDPEVLADTYLVLFDGAIALAVAYRDDWPIKHAERDLDARLKQG